jgi:ATP-binding cassette subfamily A (ABC1) protein 3
MQPLRK